MGNFRFFEDVPSHQPVDQSTKQQFAMDEYREIQMNKESCDGEHQELNDTKDYQQFALKEYCEYISKWKEHYNISNEPDLPDPHNDVVSIGDENHNLVAVRIDSPRYLELSEKLELNGYRKIMLNEHVIFTKDPYAADEVKKETIQ